jgi:hypothetical protein
MRRDTSKRVMTKTTCIQDQALMGHQSTIVLSKLEAALSPLGSQHSATTKEVMLSSSLMSMRKIMLIRLVPVLAGMMLLTVLNTFNANKLSHSPR